MNASTRKEFTPINTIIRDENDEKLFSIFTVYSDIGSPDHQWETYVMKYRDDGYTSCLKTAYARNRTEAIRHHINFVKKYSIF